MLIHRFCRQLPIAPNSPLIRKLYSTESRASSALRKDEARSSTRQLFVTGAAAAATAAATALPSSSGSERRLVRVDLEELAPSLSAQIAHGQVEPVAVSAGWKHAAITLKELHHQKYYIVMSGLNESMQLGCPRNDENIQRNLIPCPHGKQPISIACGREHTAVVLQDISTKRTELFTFGRNSFGQLANGINKADGLLQYEWNSDRPIQFTDRVFARSVACGLDHTVVLGNNGKAYTAGWNADGQLGRTSDDSLHATCRPFPVGVEGHSLDTGVLSERNIRKITCSADTTLALTEDGSLFAWGNSEYGQAMLGSKIDRVSQPVKVDTLSHSVVDIAAGSTGSLVLCDDGNVYGCGYGPIGTRRDDVDYNPADSRTPPMVLRPRKVIGLPSGMKANSIHAGFGYYGAVLDNKQLWLWGINDSFNRLGTHKPRDTHGHPLHCDTPTKLDFGSVHNEDIKCIDSVGFGGNAMYLIASLFN
ncbi:RCC1/BLIP-II [Ramicandelaber brevisporus]|nr:RCC1/BLIP-II [Ramicandelaber brevisporus]